MRHFLLIFFLFPLVLLSQYKRTIFLEGGTSINQSFYPKENISGKLYTEPYGGCATGFYPQEIGYYNSKIKRSSTFSFYAKLGIEARVTNKKRLNLSFPFILGYREYRENYRAEIEEFYSASSSRYYTYQLSYYSTMVSVIFGPKVTYQFEKLSLFTTIYFNSDLRYFYHYKEKSYYRAKSEIRNPGFNGLTAYHDFSLGLSMQNGVLYKINSKFAIGLTGDVFFYNINPNVIRYSKKDNYLFNFGNGTNSTIINTGIRLQYSF